MKFIFSGDGESPYQEREQWTDGCNLVAIKPGVALGYDRNPVTEKAFRRRIRHYTCMRFLKSIEPAAQLDTLEKYDYHAFQRVVKGATGDALYDFCPIERESLSVQLLTMYQHRHAIRVRYGETDQMSKRVLLW